MMAPFLRESFVNRKFRDFCLILRKFDSQSLVKSNTNEKYLMDTSQKYIPAKKDVLCAKINLRKNQYLLRTASARLFATHSTFYVDVGYHCYYDEASPR